MAVTAKITVLWDVTLCSVQSKKLHNVTS